MYYDMKGGRGVVELPSVAERIISEATALRRLIKLRKWWWKQPTPTPLKMTICNALATEIRQHEAHIRGLIEEEEQDVKD